ncbi:MAG: hypothetical protein K2H73_06485, partial [Treponemataceae bacterium]|nr:hypothetical protein [Treponemataceae bacterium]
VDCTFASDNAGNSFGSVVVAKSVTNLILEGQTNVSALVSAGEASVKITVSADVKIEKADGTMIDAVTKAAEESGIPIVIPQLIPDDELKALQDAFEESKKNPADSTPGNTTPGDNGETNPKVIPRGSRIAAKYVQKMVLAFYADGTAVMTQGWSVSGTYTKEANGDLTVRMPFLSDDSDENVNLAKINGNTMTLYYYDEAGNLDEHTLTLTKKATNSDPSALTEWEWNGSLSLTFDLDGTVQFFEDSALCWTGTYTVTKDNFAVTEDVRQVGSPWGEDDMTSPPLKVEFDFSYKNALSPNVYTDEGGGWSPFLTRVGDITVKTPTSGGNTSGTAPGGNTETTPGGNDDGTSGTTTSGTNPGNNNGDNTGGTTTGGDDEKVPEGIPRGSRIAATYIQKAEIALYADGTAVFTMALPVSGTYTKEANGDLTVHIPFSSDSSDEMVEVAKINGDTLSLYSYNEDGSLNEEEATTFTKKATNNDPSALSEWEWNGQLSLTFALDGTVQFLEDSALCWTGTYTVTKDNFAVTKDVRQVGSQWDDMTLPVKVEFTFDENALMWDVLYEGGGCSSFLTQSGDITVEAPTSGTKS